MAVAEEIVILVKAETKKAIDDLKSMEKQTDATSKSADNFGKMFAVGGVVAGAAATLYAVSKAAFAMYTEFAGAELSAIKLNAAVKNADQLSKGAGDRLSAFADDLQDVSIFEADATKAIIANMAAMGKSESQIKEITLAAADYASATGIDLQTAINQLSATLNGSARELGRQNTAIKNLTVDQLKNGDAIKIIAEQYKGFSKEVGESASGSMERFRNSLGDLKEGIGESVATFFTPLINGLTAFINKINDSTSGLKNLKSFIAGETITGKGIDDAIAEATKQLQKLKDQLASGYGSTSFIESGIVLLEKRIIDLKKAKEEDTKASIAATTATNSLASSTDAAAKAAERATSNDRARLATWAALDEAGAGQIKMNEDLAAAQEATWQAMNERGQGYFDMEADGAKRYQEEVDKARQIYEELSVDQEEHSNAEYEANARIIAQLQEQIDYNQMLADAIQNNLLPGFEAVGEAIVNGEGAMDAMKEAAKGAISAILKALGAELAARAALSLLAKDFGAAALGFGASAAAYTASGMVKALAHGGEVVTTGPTNVNIGGRTFLAGEAGAERITVEPIRPTESKGSVTVVQNIGGSVLTEDYLTARATAAVARAGRGY